MSLEIIKAQVFRFLASDKSEVIAIKGAWGSGKTYAWKRWLALAIERDEVLNERYSYISLFGVDSLDELKYLVFQQAIPKRLIGKEASVESFKENALSLTESLGRKAARGFFSLKRFSGLSHAVESLAFLSIQGYVICIDDLERKGRNLPMRDVLGLVSALKEEKDCKVVVIQNEGSLEGTDLDDYKKYREKVIDIELVFQPTSDECAEIVLDPESELDSRLLSHVTVLEIDNIRVVKRIQTLARLLEPLVADLEEEIQYQIFHSLVLLTWCQYGPDDQSPSIEYIKNIGFALFGMRDDDKLSDDEKRWNAYLHDYQFFHTDELDLAVAHVVETGYVIEDDFLSVVRKKNEAAIATKGEQSFSDIWRLYHDSFDDNQKQFIVALSEGIKRHAKYVSPMNLGGTVRVLRDLGRDDLADRAIDDYVEARKNETNLFDLEDYTFSGEITDKRLIEVFNKINSSKTKPPSLREALDRIAGKDGWGSIDEKALADALEEDYYQLFKSEKGRQLSSYVKAALQFSQFSNATEQQKSIGEKATAALMRIGKESPINARRVAKFGIEVGDGDLRVS